MIKRIGIAMAIRTFSLPMLNYAAPESLLGCAFCNQARFLY